MRIEILTPAHRHGITEQEIRSVVEYPLTVYRIRSRSRFQDADLYRHIGDPTVVIEVAADLVTHDRLVVFHAMTLRHTVALEAFHATGRALDLRNYVTAQRR